MKYEDVKQRLRHKKKTWLITGVAGFIGSSLLEQLLRLNQKVVGLDNFSTGSQRNIGQVENAVGAEQWSNFRLVTGDICDFATCARAVDGVDFVLHQAALGSVPRSIKDPINSNASNVSGFLNMLEASRVAEVTSFTYAASSSTYGDHPALPKVEENIGSPLSPYAVTKYVNELYAAVYARSYGFKTIGLRYFNVFGKRQDPDSAYAAVIPKWISAMIRGDHVIINGDGSTSRDFCFIENVVQANILASLAPKENKDRVYNVAYGGRTSLIELFEFLKLSLAKNNIRYSIRPIHKDFRKGDVLHSQADISKARNLLGYQPEFDIRLGIDTAMPWYIKELTN